MRASAIRRCASLFGREEALKVHVATVLFISEALTSSGNSLFGYVVWILNPLETNLMLMAEVWICLLLCLVDIVWFYKICQ